MAAASGYANPAYARVYENHGTPVHLSGSGGSLLRRGIPHTNLHDLAGCYPVFCCPQWEALGDDLALIGKDNVSIVLVADPFLEGGQEQLSRLFGFTRPFKTHYVADLSQPLESYVPQGRIRNAMKARRKIDVGVAANPLECVDDFLELQALSRHGNASNELSRDEVVQLFTVPGIVILHAVHEGRAAGMHVEFHQDNIVFGHFAVYDPAAYRLGVSTALHLFEIEHFLGRARWIDWGGVPGTKDARTGLSRFKQDFSNTTRMAFLCGSVFDRAAYDELSSRQSTSRTEYFPAYRACARDAI